MNSSPSALFTPDVLPEPQEPGGSDQPAAASAPPENVTMPSAVPAAASAAAPVPRPVARFEPSHPWPLGVPTARQALEAIAGQLDVDEALQDVHLQVLATLPEATYDAVRSALAGAEDPIAQATATGWRAVVAADRLDAALGVDSSAAQLFTAEAVQARELLRASAYLALDAGKGQEEFLSLLGEAIDALAGKSSFKARMRRTGAAAMAGVVTVHEFVKEDARTTRILPKIFAATMAVTLLFHGVAFLRADRAEEAWVVVGDVEHGHAFIAPARQDADQAALARMRARLEARGFSTSLSPTGNWVVTRAGKGNP